MMFQAFQGTLLPATMFAFLLSISACSHTPFSSEESAADTANTTSSVNPPPSINPPPAPKITYENHEKAQVLIDEMVVQHGFDRDDLIALFSEAERKEKILEAIARPAEKTLEWAAYRKIFLTSDRIEQGLAFIQTYAEPLARAEKELGVPKEIITAIIGVETRFGKHMGSHRVLDALSTLGFDYPPRADFFRSELKHALLLAREQGFDLREMKGSYAGAMGYGQFIPSSYRNFAIDFDGDHIVDILTNPVDAIGSVANYFVRHHWVSGAPVAFRLSDELSDELNQERLQRLLHNKLKPAHRLQDFADQGITLPAGLDLQAAGKIQLLNGEQGAEYWLTLDNFYVITRYNHSHLYAMAVYQLARELGLPER